MNFTPRQRQSNRTLFQPKPVVPRNSLFGGSQVSAFFSQSQRQRTPPREEEYEEENSSVMRRRLKPLPDRTASPTKSIIRSPLKPKTPGRKVEFTSSTLSPLAQAQARAERRASMSPEKQNDDRPPPGRRNVVNLAVEEDKENQSSSPSISGPPSLSPSSSPSPSPSSTREQQRQQQQRPQNRRLTSSHLTSSTSTQPQSNISTPQPSQKQPQPPQLSPTTWTRDHWIRLDELLQARKNGTLQFQLETARRPTASFSSSRSNAPSQSCRHLFGKIVTAQGESMPLQEWHLDVVEAFLAEISRGGDAGRRQVWDGTQIAKRVFALLVGEERRRLGMVPSRRGPS
jgi:hypothetical protein